MKRIISILTISLCACIFSSCEKAEEVVSGGYGTNSRFTYFVLDPIALKEGETQWLQLNGKQCEVYHIYGTTTIHYVIDNVEYSSQTFICAKKLY